MIGGHGRRDRKRKEVFKRLANTPDDRGRIPYAPHICPRLPHHLIAIAAGQTMRPRAQPQVRLVAPVDDVVAALAPRPRPVGDLVVPKPGRSQLAPGQLVLVGGRVRVGRVDNTTVEPALHRRPRLNGQAVEADVGHGRRARGQGQHGGQRLRPVGHALSRQAVDEIEVEVVEAGCRGHPYCLDRGGEVVGAPQQGQFARQRALHAEAKPVDTQGAHVGQPVGRHRARVGLHGDLRVARQSERRARCVQQVGHLRHGQ